MAHATEERGAPTGGGERGLDQPLFRWPEPQPLSSCAPRRRACGRGEIHSCVEEHEPRRRFLAVLSDGSGEVVLVFLGRGTLPGFVRGARLEVEGMFGLVDGRLAMLNPRYRFLL